jgi:CRP-like cAMP-binding protein
MEERYREVLNVYRNPTKTKIITLLVNNKKMTVTGMAKYIKTTRSNLYQIMSELVSLGMVNEPEIRPKKNYVEKYYSLNEDYFAFHDEKIDDEIMGLPEEQFRETLASFLMAQSLNLGIMASAVENMSEQDIGKIRNDRQLNIMSFGTVSRRGASSISAALTEELKKTIDDSGNDRVFLFLMLPTTLIAGRK